MKRNGRQNITRKKKIDRAIKLDKFLNTLRLFKTRLYALNTTVKGIKKGDWMIRLNN